MTTPNAHLGPENAWPVREVNSKIAGWVNRLGQIWVEGQITQLNEKPSWSLVYLTLRDPEVEASISVTTSSHVLRQLPAKPRPGDRVVVFGKPQFYEKRGSLSLKVTDIRPVGVGELLARIEMLRHKLAQEGLFSPDRKKPLPFLPRNIGLITGRGSAAERDVISVAQGRWPQVQFTVINTAVQGPRTVPEVINALQELDANQEVDVIIIARGGGSVEDLLPFSEEALQRAVAQCSTPVVSAIGHEPDNPVLDNVADFRAATPTDAAKSVVPDVAAERALIFELRQRSAASLRGWVQREQNLLQNLRSRPVLSDPMAGIHARHDDIESLRIQVRRMMGFTLKEQISTVAALRSQIATLGPAATLARGYSVVQVIPRDGSEPEVVTSITQSPPGSQLRIRVGDGSITAAAMQATPAD